MGRVNSYALDELGWPQVARHLERDPRLMLVVGALDQHGSHLPLGTNTYIAERVVEQVSEHVGMLRAPSFSYGVTTAGGPFAGRAGLRRKTLHRAINEMLGRWEDHGIRDFRIVTAHRYEPHLEALLMALSARSATTVYDLFQIDVADLLEGNPELENGGELETSLMLHLAPERVRMADLADHVPQPGTLRRYMRGRVPTPPASSTGTVGRPSIASAEKGRAVFQRFVDGLTAALERDDDGSTGTW